MWPWSSAARRAVPRNAAEVERDLANLRKLADAETDLDGVLLGKGRLDQAHIARTLTEASVPEGLIELHRVWRDIDAMMGPAGSVLQALTARFPALRSTTRRMNGHLRMAARTRGATARGLVLARMDRELAAFAGTRKDILRAVDADARGIGRRLTAEMDDAELRRLGRVTADEARKECATALDEFERSLRDLRKGADGGKDTRPGTARLRRAAEEQLTVLRRAPGQGRRKVLSTRIARLAEFAEPMEAGPALARRIKTRMRTRLPALDDVPDTSLMFMEALGAVAQARHDGAKLLRRYAEEAALDAQEMRRVQGYLGQIAGLLPEEMAIRMRFMDGIFHKAAFETLADFPPELRGRITVELVEGPLSVLGRAGPPRQFGDGCMLVTGPRGQSVMAGLGELKAGFDEDLLTQLFVRSDGRAASARVRFTDAAGEVQIRDLTRQIDFGDGKRVAVSRPPVYVYGRPGGETPETAEKFRQMVSDQMTSGREMWKIQLPFSADANREFADETLKAAVRALVKAKPSWGR